jgi:hypothetical protein
MIRRGRKRRLVLEDDWKRCRRACGSFRELTHGSSDEDQIHSFSDRARGLS